jgi:acyl-CoA synthetase (AMP-forming)/AMP-acid ligase II
MHSLPTQSCIWSLFATRADESPDLLFAVDEQGRSLTFGEIHTLALRLAATLEPGGIGPGSVVSWQFPNQLEAMVLLLALCRLGAVQNPLISILREREVQFICEQARSSLLVVPSGAGGAPFRSVASAVAAELSGLDVLVLPEDVLMLGNAASLEPNAEPPIDALTTSWYFYTSGTTADPKGAMHSDVSMIAGSKGFIEALTITADDRMSLLVPLTHIGGVIRLVTSLLTGASFVPAAAVDFLRIQRATVIPGSMPFVHAYFAIADADPSLEPLFPDARLMMHGGSPKPPELHYRVKERFGTAGIISGYGMTECPMSIWNRPGDADEDLAHTEGRPVSGVEVRIVGADGAPLGPGIEGEIRLRGPQLMKGYVDASLDADAFDADGYIRSGDLGTIDANSRLRVTGRLKDIIIRNMENISALEVENLLFTHPQVKEAAVIGVPDARTGERVCAVVVALDPAAPPTLVALIAHLAAAGLSTRKLPERLELIDALPRNAMDKVSKVDLRARFAGS